MKVAIIGAGNVGRALATSARRAGHDVTISAKNPDHAAEVASQTGAQAVESSREGVRSADVVILAVPVSAIDEIASELSGSVSGKAVVDVSNRPTPDPSGEATTSAAEDVQARLPEAGVVKAFNTVFASNQANPVVDGVPLDGYVAGDDPNAKQKVLELVRSIGFRPVDVGPLVMARTLEALAWLNISLNMNNKWSWQTGWKLVGPAR
jgi:8-hydroxy-5-deazaflavin:NADPH oxidoreductase